MINDWLAIAQEEGGKKERGRERETERESERERRKQSSSIRLEL